MISAEAICEDAMDLKSNWDEIKRVFGSAIGSSRHCAIATIRPDGAPHVTPIGFIFLRDDQTAYYFEEHARQLPSNIAANPSVCLLLVNSGLLFWASFLLRGRFSSAPGVRLSGVAGDLRAATPEELDALQGRIKRFLNFKGGALIWSHLTHVRDIRIEQCEPVAYPNVTARFWR
jgi:hypothetical protein